MGLVDWFKQFVRTVDTEYERRVKAASQVVEYGQGHAHAHDDAHHAAAASEEDEGEVAEIMNIPRGARVGAASQAQPERELRQQSH